MHEIQVARKLKLQRGTMLVFDRGYMDYDWFQRLTEEGVQFVTLNENATNIVVERRQATGDGVRERRNARTSAINVIFGRKPKIAGDPDELARPVVERHVRGARKMQPRYRRPCRPSGSSDSWGDFYQNLLTRGMKPV